jgi:hypothetical protein
MKYLLLLCLLIGAFSSFSRADLVIVQKVEGAGQVGDITMKFKGDKMRADVSPQITTITDTVGGDITTIMHAEKRYMKIPASQTKALLQQVQKSQPGSSPSAAPKLQPTGKKEKIGGYDAEQFTCQVAGMKVDYWIAKDFPNYAAVLAQMEKMQQGGFSAMTRGMAPSPADFHGMPIRTEMEMGGKKISTTVVSVKDEPIDDKEFTIPAGYTAMEVPSFSAPSAHSAPSAPGASPSMPSMRRP